MKSFIPLVALLLTASVAESQVNSIKSASSSYGSSGSISGGDGGSSSSGFMADFMFNIFFGGIIQGQQNRLERRADVPTMVSLDLMAQVAVQPSSYYIAQPRIRANWGLFSTDFRMNYLIEDGVNGYTHIRTNDWQILEFNIISTRDFNARIGGGVMQEAFEGHNGFAEWTLGLQYQSEEYRWGGYAEYRGAEVRREFSSFAQYKLFDKGLMHGFATAGFVFQRYYSSINTWGLQGGMMLKFY